MQQVIIRELRDKITLKHSLAILTNIVRSLPIDVEWCPMDIMAAAPHQAFDVASYAGFKDMIDMANFVSEFGLKEIYKELLPNEYTEDYIRIKRLFDNHSPIN